LNILGASFAYNGEENCDVLDDYAVVFDKKIIDFLPFEEAKKRYSGIKTEFFRDALLMPSFANPHIHPEFGANRCNFTYGEFTKWLGSVIKKSPDLPICTTQDIENELSTIIKKGVTALGVISSNGYDLEACAASSAKIVYFNETVGSNPELKNMFFEKLLERYEKSKKLKSDRFIPALSPHAPYSTHPLLVREVLELAKKEQVLVSTHFLESMGEKEWLSSNSGELKSFFSDFFEMKRDSFLTPLEYIDMFEGVKTLFVHNLFADKNELEAILKIDATLVSCPRSNRLLNSARFDINQARNIGLNPLFATDGMSSNIDTHLLEELKFMIFINYDLEINDLAKYALFSSTALSHKVLGFEAGILKKGFDSDFIIVDMPQDYADSSNKHLDIILHGVVKKTYINGELYGDY